MGKFLLKAVSLGCAMIILTTFIGGCTKTQKTSSSQTASSPASLTIFMVGGVWKDDTENPELMQLEKATNTKIQATLVTTADFTNKYNVLAASDSLPDISQLKGFTFQQYADQGLYMDIGSAVNKWGSNLKKNLKQSLWDQVKYKGKQYAIPYDNNDGKNITAIRQDWLDNLNLKMPTTLDEYKKILEQFTFKDPDQNGKNDTYGLGAVAGWSAGFTVDFDLIFGAFGIGRGMSYIKDNKVYNTMISDQYKSAVKYIKSLWDEKVIDPEMFTIKTDQANQKLLMSKSGTVTGWWSVITMVEEQLNMKAVNPKALWNPVSVIKGEGGQGGYRSNGNIYLTCCISTKCKQVEAAIKFLDYLSTEDGYLLGHKGIKGTDWTNKYGPLTPEGQVKMDAKWLDVFAQLVSRLDLDNDSMTNATSNPMQTERNRFSIPAMKNNQYTDALYGIPATTEKNTFGTDVSNYEVQSFIKFVTGAQPLTDTTWADYVSTWKNKGGQGIVDSMVKEYNSIKGTKYTSGN